MFLASSSYQLSDFLLFSKDAYFAMIKNYNQSIWPLQIVFLFLSVFIVYLLIQKRKERLIFFLSSLSWIFVSYFYHIKFFSQINWAATNFSYLFVFIALLFLFLVFRPLKFKKEISYLGLGLFLIASFFPFTNSFTKITLFGWGADATALGSIGILLSFQNSFRKWGLILFIALWLLFAALMHWTLNSTY